MKFKGTFSVTITPTKNNGDINVKSLKNYFNWQINKKIGGLIILGSTGEFLSIKKKNRLIMIKESIAIVDKRVPLLVGTAAENTNDAIKYSIEAQKLGADGVMIIPPFYSTPTNEELFNHFNMISREIDIPIMVYNNPATSNVDMLPETFAKLSKIKNINYCKESTMDVTRVKDIIRLSKGKIKVFGGIMGYESYLNGADGWVSVPSNLVPNECTDIYKNIKLKKDFTKAKKIYDQITPIIKLVGGHYYVAATKYMLNLMGFNVGKPLLPRLDLDFKKKKECQKIFKILRLKKIIK
jgi:4-hydroxy-tetrahydrodipicolinate synthase